MAPASLSVFLISVTTAITLLRQPYIIAAAATSPVTPLSSPVNATAATAGNKLQCVDSRDWATTAFQPYDCYTAISLFEDYEVYRHSTTLFEFYAATVRPPSPQRFSQTTPRQYTYKSCTLAVALIADLPAGAVPGLPERPNWPRTDVGTFAGIWQAGLGVRDVCLSVVGGAGGKGKGRVGFVNPTGYETVGLHGAIGVFLWDTNGALNQFVKGRVGSDVVVRGGNVTVTAG
ncbi:MAG: hypothetical protein Q9161_008166 [Pseudevernia consocians]